MEKVTSGQIKQDLAKLEAETTVIKGTIKDLHDGIQAQAGKIKSVKGNLDTDPEMVKLKSKLNLETTKMGSKTAEIAEKTSLLTRVIQLETAAKSDKVHSGPDSETTALKRQKSSQQQEEPSEVREVESEYEDEDVELRDGPAIPNEGKIGRLSEIIDKIGTDGGRIHNDTVSTHYNNLKRDVNEHDSTSTQPYRKKQLLKTIDTDISRLKDAIKPAYGNVIPGFLRELSGFTRT